MARKNQSSARLAEIRQAIDAFVASPSVPVFNYKQVAAAVGIDHQSQLRSVALYLAELAFDGKLIEVGPGQYKSPTRAVTAVGTFVRLRNGKNSVIIDDDGSAIFVAERNSMHALNGDRVNVTIAAHVKGREPEAIVNEIIEKKEQTFIGTLRVERHIATLIPDSKFLATDIIIPRAKLHGGTTGDKAVVEIVDWPADANCPTGRVIDILGKTGENNAEMHAILAEYGLPYKYPEAVEKAADKISDVIPPQEIDRRIDMRSVTTFTIDPHDAKDFDDALSIRAVGSGEWEVGVHIADVTYYVKPGSIIDREAEDRATSVYLVDRTVPMLPERLCNGICSLRPDEDKLTFSVLFRIDDKGKVLSSQIARTVIRSDRRFAYEEAQQVIETGTGDLAEEILTLDRLAKILRQQRMENGSMEFDRVEVRFNIDETGHPTGVYFKESKDANKLIEEFMLLANRTVAAFVGEVKGRKKPKAFVYRVHDCPDPERLENLATISRTFGYRIKSQGNPQEVNRSINKMLTEVKGRGEENFLSILAIRSMAKAIYTSVNIGHYGLGFEYYTHFTSPIRRYPDMMVHRLLERYLAGGRTVSAEKLEDLCKHCSDQEQLAANAERASIKYKQVEYMNDHLGQVYSGTISGVTEWGLYVEIDENKCEGLVPMRDLDDDFYDFDEKNYCLVGRRRNTRYRLGDPVQIQVARCNLDRKQLDFLLVDERHPARSLERLGAPAVANSARRPEKKRKAKYSKSSKQAKAGKASKSKSNKQSNSSKSGKSRKRK